VLCNITAKLSGEGVCSWPPETSFVARKGGRGPCLRNLALDKKNASRKLGKQKRWWNMALTKTKTKDQQGMLKRREGYGINRTFKRQPARLRKQWKMNQSRRKAGGHRKRLLVHLVLGKVVAAVGTSVRGNCREGTSAGPVGHCWSEGRWPLRQAWWNRNYSVMAERQRRGNHEVG